MALRLPTSLPAETEAVIKRVIGCAIAVHRELGPGYQESVYSRALAIELDAEGIRYEREAAIQVIYRNQPVALYKLDLVIEQSVVVELKCVDRLLPLHQAQLIGYLRASRHRVGLLINFKVALIPDGLKRVIL